MASNYTSVMSQLPAEIIEMIMAQLPLSDLLSCHSLVCQRWREIIHSPSFIPWKKLYFHLKVAPESLLSGYLLGSSRINEKFQSVKIIQLLFEQFSIDDIRNCLFNIIRLVGKLLKHPDNVDIAMTNLKKHRLYELAIETLTYLCKSVNETAIPQPVNIWHLMTMIVLLARDMWDVDDALRSLLLHGTEFTAVDVVEAFYCLACVLLYGIRQFNLPSRYHYLVYYALYLYENSWSVQPQEDPGQLQETHGGQQSILRYGNFKPPFQYTHEQMRIINHNLENHHVVKIVAFAGTGKTSTLLQMCKQRPHLKFLLVVYNKSVQLHCEKTFPRNVTARTAHSLAFAKSGFRFNSIGQMGSDLKSYRLVKFLPSRENGGNVHRRAALAKRTVDAYVNSADELITLCYVPTNDKHGQIEDDFRLKVILADAELVWNEMRRCSRQQQVQMSQDGQLKLFQLSKPVIGGYDVILLDEGQDMNSAMFNIFLNQKCAKVVVGDPHQQIYSFRGAVNALDMVSATHTYFLTQSFRFGPEIAYVANIILETEKKVTKQTLVGGRKQDSYLHQFGDTSRRTFLARANKELYKKAVTMVMNADNNGKTMSFAGGIEKYGFEDVLDLYKLSQVQQGRGTAASLGIRNGLIARFKSVQELKNFASSLEDIELTNKIGMYEFSGNLTPIHYAKLMERCNSDPVNAELVFSTIHKSKGMEWDWVILLDDHPPLDTPDLTFEYYDDECNLLYVAITRAKKWVSLNSCALQVMTKASEKFEVLVSRREAFREEECLKCLQCGEEMTKVDEEQMSPVVTKVLELSLSGTSEKFDSGIICDTCAGQNFFLRPETRRWMAGPEYAGSERAHSDYTRIARWAFISGFAHLPCVNSSLHRSWDKYELSSHHHRIVAHFDEHELIDFPDVDLGNDLDSDDSDMY